MSQDQSELNYSLALLHCLLPDIHLNNIQTTVFLQSWQGRTYQQIADSTGYDSDYLKDVGHKLWRKLSAKLREPISKHNFCSVLRRRYHEFQELNIVDQVPKVLQHSNRLSRLSSYSNPVCDWGEAPVVPIFTGRNGELQLLKQWIVRDHIRLVGIFGLGGVGKTAFAVQCVEKLSEHFDYLIWRSLRNTPDFNVLMDGLLQCLCNQVANPPETPTEKVSLLLKYFKLHRCLLVIDEWDSILRSDSLAGCYQDEYGYYGLLLRRLSESQHQSCVIVVSREKPAGSSFRDNPIFPVRTLYLKGLSREAGRKSLKAFGLSGQDFSLDQLLESYGGNPYALRIVAKTVIDFFNSDISKFLNQGNLIYGDIRTLLQQQFDRLSKLEKVIINCFADLPELVSMNDLERKLSLVDYNENLLEILESLYYRSFIEREDVYFRLPLLVQKYVNHSK